MPPKYTRMVRLRSETERALGAQFDAQQFNDTVLAQGLLPPDLLESAVRAQLPR